jgi:hypothetical protein
MAKAPTMDEWAEKLGTIALNSFEYNGRTLREWIDLMASGYCVVLPDGAMNGDVVKAVFPNLEHDKERLRQKYGSQALYDTFEKWCELPYKVGDTDGNN